MRLRWRRRRRNMINLGELIKPGLVLASVLFIFFVLKAMFFSSELESINEMDVAAFRVPIRTMIDIQNISNDKKLDFVEVLNVFCVENNFFPEKIAPMTIEQLERNFFANFDSIKEKYDFNVLNTYYNILKIPINDLKYFPIPEGYNAEDNDSYIYGDSYGSPREYGGNRPHLGCDIEDRENIRGRIPIVSMTDGVIENIGWNEKGGYRVGVRSENGGYYYYAHLSSYAQGLDKGMKITAGTHLGYMGDTGYSTVEGTVGNFPVHLHVGIQINTNITSEEFWINPYPFLRLIEPIRAAKPK